MNAAVPHEVASNDIKPFQVNIQRNVLHDLRRRISATRFADPEIVRDQSQGVQDATLRELARYWADEYDMDRLERRLNAVPQFKTSIDGVDVHFIHVRSRHRDALPLIITHGWPGSVVELLSVVDPLTDPTAHGGSAADAFHVVIPSMPGYGFSSAPAETGWNSARIARAWDLLMTRLGYTRYVAQGGDWGARVCECMAHQAPPGLEGIHMNLLLTLPQDVSRALAINAPAPSAFADAERNAYDQLRARGPVGYRFVQGTRPQTIGASLADTPVGLAAWLLDHDHTSYLKMAAAIAGDPAGSLSRDEILDNTTLYWVTNSATSAARLYWEEGRMSLSGSATGPAAYTVFPDEYLTPPRSWVAAAFDNLVYFHEAERGGHFASWEEPAIFTEEVRAAFRSRRRSDGAGTHP